MKTTLTFILFFFTIVQYTNAQSLSGWSIPTQEMVFKNEKGEVAKMWMGPGFRYADIEYQDKSYRVFYHRDKPAFSRARIVDNETQKLVARARGSIFWRTSRFKFESGDEVKVVRKQKPNGYEVLGPYGMLFKVENHGVSPVVIYNEKDFLAHAFFLFDRIKFTQTPPADIIMLMPPPSN